MDLIVTLFLLKDMISSVLEQGLIPRYFLQMLCRSLIGSVNSPFSRQKAEIKGVM